MKSVPVLAALGALLGLVSAHGGHNHEMLRELMKKDAKVSPVNDTNSAECGCVTSVVTWYGDATCKS